MVLKCNRSMGASNDHTDFGAMLDPIEYDNGADYFILSPS